MQTEVIKALRISPSAFAAPDQTLDGLPSEIMFLPEGAHMVSAQINGKPGTCKVVVGPDALAPLQASLAARLKKNVRPHGGFDHKEGAAAFLPKSFRYQPGRGVMLQVEWTQGGKQAVEGKDYSYFSPTFLRDTATGKPRGLMDHGEVGSLVNNPAFEAIERIAAAHSEPAKPSSFHSSVKSDRLKSGGYEHYSSIALPARLETVNKALEDRSQVRLHRRLRGSKEALEFAIGVLGRVSDTGGMGLSGDAALKQFTALRDAAGTRAKTGDGKALGEFDIYYDIVKFMKP